MDYVNYFKKPANVSFSKASKKPYKGQAHTPASSKGIGDYYGTGIVAKIGRVRDNPVLNQQYAKNLKKPPKSLA